MDPRVGLSWLYEGMDDGQVGQFSFRPIQPQRFRSAVRFPTYQRPDSTNVPINRPLMPWASISVTRSEGHTLDFRGYANGNVNPSDVKTASAFLESRRCVDSEAPTYSGMSVGGVTCGDDWVQVNILFLSHTPGPFMFLPMNQQYAFTGRVRASDANTAVRMLKLQFKTWGQHCTDNGMLYDPMSQRCFSSCRAGQEWDAQALMCRQVAFTR